MKKRSALSALSLLVGIGLVLSACASGTTNESGSAGSTKNSITYAIGGEPLSLNPVTVNDRWGLTITNMIYSPLARVEADGSFSNDLAESITMAEDNMSVTVVLKPDLLWSDGKPLTAEDVVFTYNNKMEPKNGNSDQFFIGGRQIVVSATDERTVLFSLPSPSAAAISNIVTETYIMPKHTYEKVTDFSAPQLDPVALGSGPYMLKEYKRGEYFTLEANPKFAGDIPNIPELNVKIVSNADTAKTALQTGELDGALITTQQADEFAGSDVKTYVYPEGRVAYLGVISNKIADPDVRQALFYSLDRKQLSDASWLNSSYYKLAYSILPPSNPFSSEDVQKYDTDVDKAKALLADSGQADLRLVLGYPNSDPAYSAQATLIQEQASKAGITVTLEGLDQAAVTAELEKGKESRFDIFLGGYIMGTEPDLYSSLFRTRGSNNSFAFSSQRVDQLFDQGIAEFDMAKRKPIYAELQKDISDAAIIYPIAENLKVLAMNKRVTNVEEAKTVPIYALENFGKLNLK